MKVLGSFFMIKSETDFNYHDGIGQHLQSFSCGICGESCVATYFPPCYTDNDRFLLQLQLSESTTLKTISAVGDIFSKKYTDIYKMHKAGQEIIFRATLRDALAAADYLDERNILYQISPIVPYSEITECHKNGNI